MDYMSVAIVGISVGIAWVAAAIWACWNER